VTRFGEAEGITIIAEFVEAGMVPIPFRVSTQRQNRGLYEVRSRAIVLRICCCSSERAGNSAKPIVHRWSLSASSGVLDVDEIVNYKPIADLRAF
jgi:hypothetical protein